MTEEKSPSVQQSRVERSHFCICIWFGQHVSKLGWRVRYQGIWSTNKKVNKCWKNVWSYRIHLWMMVSRNCVCVKMKAKRRVGDVVEQ
jgi:hypothetical protein